MIYINNREISNVYKGSRGILAAYKANRLVWTRIRELLSCFSNGYWIDEYPWADDQVWTD